jgi:hypothetical protein
VKAGEGPTAGIHLVGVYRGGQLVSAGKVGGVGIA